MRAATRLAGVLAAAGVLLVSMAGCGRKPSVEKVVQQVQLLWTMTNGSITITGYTGPATVVTVPEKINGLPVTSIGEGAFLICNHPCDPLLKTVVNATIFYLEGTRGWGKEFGGRPTAVWRPEGGTVTNGTSGVGAKP